MNLFSILYNRGVYPEESFVKVKKYGLPMLLTEDEGVKSFIANLTAQLSGSFYAFLAHCLKSSKFQSTLPLFVTWINMKLKTFICFVLFIKICKFFSNTKI